MSNRDAHSDFRMGGDWSPPIGGGQRFDGGGIARDSRQFVSNKIKSLKCSYYGIYGGKFNTLIRLYMVFNIIKVVSLL